MFERILVPLDGSETAEAVLPFVQELAQAQGSEVDVVGVSDPPGALERLLKAYLDKISEEFLAKGIKARAIILMGRVTEEILDYAEQNDISLIAMATQGRSGVTRWALGSVADRVLQGTRTPLLMINPRLTPGPREEGELFENILLPLDGSKLGEVALPYAQELAMRIGSKIWLLRVSTPRHMVMDTGEYMVTNVEEAVRGLEESSLAYLLQMEQSLKAKGITVDSRAVSGTPAETILEYAKAMNIDLILMSTPGRGGLSRWVFGSVASKTLQAAEVPVLLVRASE